MSHVFRARSALVLLALTCLASPVFGETHAVPDSTDAPGTERTTVADDGSTGDGTGTDPRDFAPKFMPYYRYTELENNLEQNEAVLFGLYAFQGRLWAR